MAQGLEIVPYDARWPEEFRAERERLARALGAVARSIEHHGSTAVPGLEAKSVIDIQVSVERLQPLEAYARPLAALGYMHQPHAEDDAVCPFFHRPATWPHNHHVHVVEFGGREERRTLAFRDFLREHAAEARAYAALKRQLAAQAGCADAASRAAYAQAKSTFVERVVQMALAAGYPKELQRNCAR